MMGIIYGALWPKPYTSLEGTLKDPDSPGKQEVEVPSACLPSQSHNLNC